MTNKNQKKVAVSENVEQNTNYIVKLSDQLRDALSETKNFTESQPQALRKSLDGYFATN